MKLALSLAARLIEIDDADQQARDAARRDVLTLTTSELPELRDALAELARQRRLTPNIVRLAYDVTLHAHVREAKLRFLDGQPPAQRNRLPFLGVTLGGDQEGVHGVPIRTTRVGFVAYEVFEEGDLLLAVRTQRGLERLMSGTDLRNAFYGLSPGDSVEFVVVRAGVVVRLSLQLDERPGDEYAPTQQPWEAAANHDAQAYWDEQIAPLLPPPTSPVARSE